MAGPSTPNLSAALARAVALLASDPGEAAREVSVILRASPTDPRAVLVLGMARRRQGDPAGAINALGPLAARQPGSFQAHVELGLARVEAGDDEAAIAPLARALELNPAAPTARHTLAAVLYRRQRAAEALAHLERLLEDSPNDAAYRSLSAACHAALGDQERAIDVYRGVLADRPDQPAAWLSLGHALRNVGRSAEAVDAYEAALALAPDMGEIYWSLANLKTRPFTVEREAAMRRVLERRDLPVDDRLHLHYALGKALEDRGDHAGSFAHYAEGARLRRGQLPYDADATHAQMLRAKTLFTPAFFEARAGLGAASTDPIFIVGLPRSGSTLVEQILASHTLVEGTAELPDVTALALSIGRPGDIAGGPRYPEAIADLGPTALLALGESYLARTRVHRKLGRPMFIDKAPNNFHHIGLIHLMLPNARIIDARRAPMAACFSAFKQHFARGHAFSYDLGDLGRYYRDYVEIMEHYDRVLPGRVHRVQYEAMVSDTETQVRRLLDYCGLAFEPACLRFHETARPVRTASSEQVRRPIFRDGLEQWRHYEPWLGPLKAALGSSITG